MKKKDIYFMLLSLCIILLFSCQKEENNTIEEETMNIPAVYTDSVLVIDETSLKIYGNLTKDGNAEIHQMGVCWGTQPDMSIDNGQVTEVTPAIGQFNIELRQLTNGETYFINTFATNEIGTAYGVEKSIVLEIITDSSEIDYGSVTDIANNEYITVVIGEQEWMAENLKTDLYNNGDTIMNGLGLTSIDNVEGSKYWFVYNDSMKYDDIYGKLYTYYTITDTRGVCPDGWRIPTQQDFETLKTTVGSDARKIRATGFEYWEESSNYEGTNETGFGALPGGTRNSTGNANYGAEGIKANFWTSDNDGELNAKLMYVQYLDASIYFSSANKVNGNSIRCIKE